MYVTGHSKGRRKYKKERSENSTELCLVRGSRKSVEIYSYCTCDHYRLSHKMALGAGFLLGR